MTDDAVWTDDDEAKYQRFIDSPTREQQYRAAAHIVTATPPSSPSHRSALRGLARLLDGEECTLPSYPECIKIVSEIPNLDQH